MTFGFMELLGYSVIGTIVIFILMGITNNDSEFGPLSVLIVVMGVSINVTWIYHIVIWIDKFVASL